MNIDQTAVREQHAIALVLPQRKEKGMGTECGQLKEAPADGHPKTTLKRMGSRAQEFKV